MVAEHDIDLRGVTFEPKHGAAVPTADRAPVLLERLDEDFIAAMLGELATENGRKQIATHVVAGARTVKNLKLYQPVHGSFNLALLDAYCKVFGEPRVDPARIDSAGLVVRRIGPGGLRQAWMREDGKVLGWVTLPAKDDPDYEPDPARREDPRDAGAVAVRRELLRMIQVPSRSEESVTSLFVAPPELCAATHRTLLYGLVPVASAEGPDGDAVKDEGYTPDEIYTVLKPYFTDKGASVAWTGLSGDFTAKSLRDEKVSADVRDKLHDFANMLRLMSSAFDAFKSTAVLAELDKLALPYPKNVTQKAGAVLKRASEVFVDGKDGSVSLPLKWPLMSEAALKSLAKALSTAGKSQLKKIIPRQKRFDAHDAQYVARAFIRVRREDGCPPKIHWSEESAPFYIAAWHENGKLPPVQVTLPAVNASNVKNFLPNVSFVVPNNLFNMLSKNKPEEVFKGNVSGGSDDGPQFGWICGFNIPIITICAFILLNIILSLLNIVFWWIALVKICIPIPASLQAKLPKGTTS